MDLWSPPHDAPHLLEWWRPLMLLSRRARLDRFPWPVHLDEFRLAGRVVRTGRPDIWIYEHHENGGSVCVDATGATYKYTATPRAASAGRFTVCELRTALWRARLPDVVEPIFFQDEVPTPRRDAWDDDWSASAEAHGGAGTGGVGPPNRESGADGGAGRADGDGSAGAETRVIRRGHLTLIAG